MAKRSFDFVNGVILDKNGNVLLEKRSDVPIWALPGGERERGEPPEAAVVREVKEETGLDVDVGRFVGRYRCSYLTYRDVTSVFLCSIKGGRMKKNHESLELHFFPANSLPPLLLFVHGERIMDALSGHKNIDKVQKITLWRVLTNMRFNPLIMVRLLIAVSGNFFVKSHQS